MNNGANNLPKCRDAVVVVPGIMGSELCDADSKPVWGLTPKVLAKAWVTGSVKNLHVTEQDFGKKPRFHATRLLRVPSYMPVLGGMEPYTDLLNRVAKTVIDTRAAAEFPYDWRLPVTHNGEKLATFCERHLRSWRTIVREQRYGDPADVRLIIVAHSMGGLVARSALGIAGMHDLVRHVITLGTPYFGSVKTINTLVTGKGTPVPARAARTLALTCPGVYDLLPRYRSVTDSAAHDSLRQFTVDDAVAIGADRLLAQEAEDRWATLDLLGDGTDRGPTPIALVGVKQPTLQSVHIADGACEFRETLDGINHLGDATVYRQSAAPLGVTAIPLFQRHGALAKCGEALVIVADKLVGADTGPPLGTRPLGVEIPDIVSAGGGAHADVYVADRSPQGITVTSRDLDAGRTSRWNDVTRYGEALRYSIDRLRPGLHRVEVKGGGYSAVSDLILAVED